MSELATMDFVTFLNNNSSAVFALAGALGTALISLASAWLLRRQDHSLKLWEKIADRRIQAHESLLESAMELRIMVALGREDESGEPLRAPHILMSRDHFDHWFTKFTTGSVSGSPWQTIEAKREANFIQDYMITLYQTIADIPSELLPNVGTIVRQDIIDLSSSFEKIVFHFFEKDIRKLSVSSLSEWHKYPRSKTEAKLLSTELLKHQQAIVARTHPAMSRPLLPDGNEDKN